MAPPGASSACHSLASSCISCCYNAKHLYGRDVPSSRLGLHFTSLGMWQRCFLRLVKLACCHLFRVANSIYEPPVFRPWNHMLIIAKEISKQWRTHMEHMSSSKGSLRSVPFAYVSIFALNSSGVKQRGIVGIVKFKRGKGTCRIEDIEYIYFNKKPIYH